MGFSRQEYWIGLPFPSPGDLPHPGIEPRSPALEAEALSSEPPGKGDLLKEFAIVFITSSIVWPQVNSREGTQLHPSKKKNGLKIYRAWPSPSEQHPVSSLVSLSHQEASKSLLSSPSEGRQTENHNHRKLTNLINMVTALSNSVKL